MAKLHFYYSAMNAGKTTTLLQSDYNYRERGMNTLLFTPSFDERYGHGKIASRIGLKAHAFTFERSMNFMTFMEDYLKKNPSPLHCILIDEAQFLTKDQVRQLTDIVDQLDIPVLAYGLRTDFMGEPFEGSQYLLAWAESLIEIKTVCFCGKKAIMNVRVDDDGRVLRQGDQIEIGGNDRYISVCRTHFKTSDHIATPLDLTPFPAVRHP